MGSPNPGSPNLLTRVQPDPFLYTTSHNTTYRDDGWLVVSVDAGGGPIVAGTSAISGGARSIRVELTNCTGLGKPPSDWPSTVTVVVPEKPVPLIVTSFDVPGMSAGIAVGVTLVIVTQKMQHTVNEQMRHVRIER